MFSSEYRLGRLAVLSTLSFSTFFSAIVLMKFIFLVFNLLAHCFSVRIDFSFLPYSLPPSIPSFCLASYSFSSFSSLSRCVSFSLKYYKCRCHHPITHLLGGIFLSRSKGGEGLTYRPQSFFLLFSQNEISKRTFVLT